MATNWHEMLIEIAESKSGKLREERNPSWFIAHLFDRVLVGEWGDEQDYPILRKAAEDDRILELHVFNRQKEIYAVWEEGQVVRYEDSIHSDDEHVEYAYELEERYADVNRRKPAFDTLVVRAYVDNEEKNDTAMAKINRTVLYALERRSPDERK